MYDRSEDESPSGRWVGYRDVVSAWMIYLVFLAGLLVVSALYLGDGESAASILNGAPANLVEQQHPSPQSWRLAVPVFRPAA